MSATPPTASHHPQSDFSDRFAWRTTRLLRFLADTFFAGRYGNRAVVLETVAAVPGMVGGALVGSVQFILRISMRAGGRGLGLFSTLEIQYKIPCKSFFLAGVHGAFSKYQMK